MFHGFEPFDYNGSTLPAADPRRADRRRSTTRRATARVGDLRGEVDQDMDPVYQDELILGFQSMIDDKWSWGVRGIYRKLNNAIDDMEITSTGIVCDGEPVGVGFVMGNPGEPLTVFTDTNCDGENDALRHDRHVARRAGRCSTTTATTSATAGYPEPKRTTRRSSS